MTWLLLILSRLKSVPIWAWAAVALLAFGGVQTARLDHAKRDLTVARSDLETSEALAHDLSGRIGAQNAAVARLAADRDAFAKALAAALAKAAPVAARHAAKADALAVYTPKGDDALAQLADLDRELGR